MRTSLTDRFQQLRWKLTLTYTGVTIAALLTVELLLLVVLGAGVISLINSGFIPTELINASSASYTPILRYYLAQTPPDQEGIAVWLEHIGFASSVNIPLTFEATDEVFVVGSDGRLFAEKPPGLLEPNLPGQELDFQVIPGLAEPLQAALAGTEDIEQLYSLARPGDKVIMTVPVWDAPHEQVLGVLVAMGEYPTLMSLVGDVAPILGVSLLFFTLVAGLAGTLYGFLAARGPVHRLNQLSDATLAWSRGDFRGTVDDPSRDELGMLAQRLNDMAQQLRHLLKTRRELIVVEERNRLARDLHDSAKQIAFAAAAQMNAARSSLKHDPHAAEAYIEEAERLTKELRQELANLIQQLRPTLLADKGLASAVREYAGEWSQQNGILVEVRLEEERTLRPDIEQSIFRIVQEALANVARHSEASKVEIRFVYTTGEFTCSVADNGVGFDPGKKHTGYGLRSMEERANAMGASLTVTSVLGKGTSVALEVPLDESTGTHQEKQNG